jgi:hypothetical protein
MKTVYLLGLKFKLAGTCVVCRQSEARYKCPACSSGYCSVKCYKEHKLSCTAPSEIVDKDSKSLNQSNATEQTQFDRIVEDPKIQGFLQSPSLKIHLSIIHQLLTNQSVTKETSAEGRRSIALKKLRELRAGGREENEQVEEFVQYVLRKLD